MVSSFIPLQVLIDKLRTVLLRNLLLIPPTRKTVNPASCSGVSKNPYKLYWHVSTTRPLGMRGGGYEFKLIMSGYT